MRHKQQGGARCAVVANAVEAFVLKVGVANGQCFVNNENIRAHCRGNAEGEADLHAAGVDANGSVEVVADFGELDDRGH